MTDAGYSGTPLQQKLGIKEGTRAAFPGAPPGFADQFTGVEVRGRMRSPLDVIVLFVLDRLRLERQFPVAGAALVANGGLWIAWPKKASGVATDLTENIVRDVGLANGLVDNKVCAIDDTWSGLRFVYRIRDRAARR